MKHLFFLLGILLSFSSIAQLYQVPVYAVTALQPAQPGNEVSKFVDGDLSTMYHSDWYQNGIPDELNFYFSSNVQSIKKIIYTPRQDGTTNGMWTVVTISYSTLENPETFLVLEENLQWELNPSVKEFELETALYHPYRIKFEVSAGKGDFSSGAEMQFFSEEEVFQNGSTDCAISTDLLSVNGENDSKAIIQGNGSYASEYQQGENIERSFDDNIGTLYHSSWSNTQFPVELNYRFDGITPLDYFKYTPRQDGGNNGNFGEVSISYNTSENETYQPLIDIDFGFSGIPSISYFPQEITPLNIKFTVYTGANGFVSCAEMAFFKQGTNEANDYDYSAIFTDDLAYELQNMITQNDIDTISSPFYQTLAQCIFDETYQKESRLRSYEVFPPIQSTSSMLKVGTYNPFENATGIAFEAGEKIALFVEHLPLNKTVQLAIKDFASSFDGAVSYYSLKNGLNVFEVENDGLGYISYFDDDETLENISINIVSGKINGVFNRATSTNSDWIEFLEYDAYPYLDIIGEFVHLVYEKQALRDVNPLKGLELVGKYDTIVQHERMLMGLFKYDKSPKNRQLTYSDRGGGWWAGGLGVHLDLEWGEAGVVHPNALDLWGIPHEYGHINQIRPDLNWIGTTEVTNNVYSVWVQYHMNHEGNSYSRMEEEWVNPSNNMPATYGGRMNGTILNTFIEGQALQETDDVFEILVPFWQLELYYSLAGASKGAPTLSFDMEYPTNEVDYANWYGTVAERVRTTDNYELSNGEYLLNFVKYTCDAVEEDLTDFFVKTGFLKPIDREIDDYGIGQLTITQAQVDQTIAEIQAKGYDAPVSPVINYISAHSKEMFKNLGVLSGETGEGVSFENEYLVVDHQEWKNAVAYETVNAQGEIVFVSISGTGDLSNQTTKVYYPDENFRIFAVGYDGERILVYPTSPLYLNGENAHAALKLFPNPTDKEMAMHLEMTPSQDEVDVKIIDYNGKLVFSQSGKVQDIENAINERKSHFKSGVYIVQIIGKDRVSQQLKWVVQ